MGVWRVWSNGGRTARIIDIVSSSFSNQAMEFVEEKIADWSIVTVPERVDAFNFLNAQTSLTAGMMQSQNLGLNMVNSRFISLAAIKLIHSVAIEVVKKGGVFVLLAPTEKIKRQFDIFASLDPIHIYPTKGEWQAKYGFGVYVKKKQVKIDDTQASIPL